MAPSPPLTIVVPTFNSGRYLPRCLRSLAEFKRLGTEVIVVDNASTDATHRVIDSHRQLIDIFVSEKDSGQSDALNKGMRLATGDFVCWLNSDDEFVPGAAEATLAALAAGQHDWYTAGTILIDADGRVLRCSPCIPLNLLLKRLGFCGVSGPAAFIRRTVVLNAGVFDEALHYCMDLDMWLRLHALGVQLARIPQYVWGFRVHINSKTSHVHLTGRMNPAMQREVTTVLEGHGFSNTVATRVLRWATARAIAAVSGRDFRALMDTAWRRGTELRNDAAREQLTSF